MANSQHLLISQRPHLAEALSPLIAYLELAQIGPEEADFFRAETMVLTIIALAGSKLTASHWPLFFSVTQSPSNRQ